MSKFWRSRIGLVFCGLIPIYYDSRFKSIQNVSADVLTDVDVNFISDEILTASTEWHEKAERLRLSFVCLQVFKSFIHHRRFDRKCQVQTDTRIFSINRETLDMAFSFFQNLSKYKKWNSTKIFFSHDLHFKRNTLSVDGKFGLNSCVKSRSSNLGVVLNFVYSDGSENPHLKLDSHIC